jgi:prepilin-type N-terminal cleavage/methylation domain-containing protein/prepilin-type processing-associated H-X9-DG protein
MHSRNRTGGFTLVELLVVIGIIAVLMGILLPALQKSRSYANQVSCTANIRQLATALNMYANDYKVFIGYASVTDRKAALYPYLKMGKNNTDNATMSVWNCPANADIFNLASYGFNTKLNFVKYARIRRPSEKVALCDGGLKEDGTSSTATHMWSPGTAPSTSACRPDYTRHPKGIVGIGYVDGHAETLPMTLPFYLPLGDARLGNGVTYPEIDNAWMPQQ